MWAGDAGTFFQVDPKEEPIVVTMSKSPCPTGAFDRREIAQLAARAVAD